MEKYYSLSKQSTIPYQAGVGCILTKEIIDTQIDTYWGVIDKKTAKRVRNRRGGSKVYSEIMIIRVWCYSVLLKGNLREIGELIGRDHSSIIFSKKKIYNFYISDPIFRKKFLDFIILLSPELEVFLDEQNRSIEIK